MNKHQTEEPVTLRRRLFILNRELFQAMVVMYMACFIADSIRPGIVSNFFNTNILLVLVLLFAIGMILTEPTKKIMRILTPKVTTITIPRRTFGKTKK